MFHPQDSLRAVPMLLASRDSLQRQMDHLVQQTLQVRDHLVHILLLHKVCLAQVGRQMDLLQGEFLQRLRVLMLFQEEMLHRLHLVYSRRVTILNTVQGQQALLVKVSN